MKTQPLQIGQFGPGIDLSNQPDGMSIRMSDPVEDFEYARNAVTLVYDLSGHEYMRLTFEAKEFGAAPHAPPPSPFADDLRIYDRALSADEIQGIHDLGS
jgi:hypothetical protein